MALLADVHFIPHKLCKYRQHKTQYTQSYKLADDQAQINKLITKWQETIGLTPKQQAKITQVIEYIPAIKEFLDARDKLS
jgi:hypothetical protein